MRIKLDQGAFMPSRAHDDDAGLDLRTPYDLVVKAGEAVIVNTGVHIEITSGYVGLLKSKSGLSMKHGITSDGGVIDAGYTGSIAVKLYNHGKKDTLFEAGDKITQLVILPVYVPESMELVDSADDLYDKKTDRGSNGFGSTGR